VRRSCGGYIDQVLPNRFVKSLLDVKWVVAV
jgi:hypothetical protein